MLRRRIPLLLFCAFVLVAGEAAASEVVLTSKSPYWDVGVRDDNLSRACSLNEFGPQHPGQLVARFTGGQGGAVLDIAKGTGVNLRDPGHLAKPTEDYFFRNVGTTSCEVLVGGRKGKVNAAH